MRRAVGLLVIVALLGACDQNLDHVEAQPTPTVTSNPASVACEPGEPLKLKGFTTTIPSRCPTSKPREVGYSEEVSLGSFWGEPPCNELPDFAGSWWKSAPPYPKHMKKAGHESITGTMTLVTEDEARFEAPQLKMVMRSRTMRIPPKGRFEVDFERIKGPAHVGGCD